MNKKILIVDDEEEITKLLADYLGLFGYTVDTSCNPVEALAMVEESNYQIVITDLMMPEMDGNELLTKVKKHNGLIQVIVITGYVTMENILAAFRRGASNVFFKPFESLDCIKTEVELAFSRMARVKQVLRDLKYQKS